MLPQIENDRLSRGALLIIAAVALAAALIYTRSVMVPFVLAVMLSYLLQPLVDLMQVRARMPRGFALALTFVVVAAGFFAVAGLIASSVHGMQENANVYHQRVLQLVQKIDALLDAQGIDLGQASITQELKKLPILSWAKSFAGGAVGFVANTLLVLIFTSFIIVGREPHKKSGGFLALVESKVRRYIVTKVLTSLATGVLVAVILLVMRLELALVFGLLAFLLNFIPSVGSLVATLLPLPVALLQYDSPLAIIAIVALPLLVQMVIGNVIEPKLMGRSLDLHSVTILLALTFWGLLWGIPGMLLATPITAILKALFESADATRPVAEVLAGRFGAVDTEGATSSAQ